MIKRIIILLLVLCFPASLFAETITLKSGKTYEGKILERTDEYIRIELYGIPVTYFLEDIESIDAEKMLVPIEDTPVVTTGVSKDYREEEKGIKETTPGKVSSDSYVKYDEELLKHGIRFIPPAGWQKVSLKKSSITYRRPDRLADIIIAWPKETPYGAAAFKLGMVFFRIGMFFQRGQKIISEEKITFCGVPCYVSTIEGIRKDRKLKLKLYKFAKNNKLYGITCISYADIFDKYLPEFEQALNSFAVLK